MRQPRKFILVALVAACMLMLLMVMSGCRPSDALREIIYDQNSTTIDYDNELKFYINNDQAEIEDQTLPSTEANEDLETTEAKQNIVVYSSDPNTTGFTAKQSLWAQIPQFTGLEASSTVNFRKSTDPSAPLEDLKTNTNDSDSFSDDSDATSLGEGDESDDSVLGDLESSTAENLDAVESSDGANDTGQGTGDMKEKVDEETTDPKGNVDYDLTNDYTQPPKVERIAAYGNVAILVQMIGGKKALAATDNDLLSSDFKKVFKDHGSSDIKTGWSDDGETADKIKISTIINSGAEALVVPSGSYLTKKQKNNLNSGGVQVVQLSKMTNSKYIKSNAKKIGQMLSESTVIEYKNGKSESRASDYSDYFDDTIDACCKAANGEKNKFAGTKIYEKKNSSKNYKYDGSAKYTLLINDYDTSASYTHTIGDWTPATNGAALSTVGLGSVPTSFYIQAGGLVNTAAHKAGSLSDGQIIVWQFNSNMCDFAKKRWLCSSDGGVKNSINMSVSDAGAWNMSLLTSFKADTGAQANLDTVSGGFGTDSFPKVIAATQQIKDRFIANSGNKNGIYHPYGLMTDSTVDRNKCGKYTSSGVVFSAIGVDGSTQLFSSDGASNDGEIPEEIVCVNPHGLFSSWTEEGSPESFLEAAWVCDVVNDDDDGSVDWEQYTKDFYKEFYDYSLSSSELATIKDGKAK